MFDLKTRKRDFEQQLFFLLEKSQTPGTKANSKRSNEEKLRDRATNELREICSTFLPSENLRSQSLFIIIARRRETEEHPPSSFSLSKRDRYKNEKKRKEKKCASSERRIEVFVFRDRSADAVGTISVNERKALFSSSSLDFENALLFTPPSPARNEKRDTHEERKKRLAHLKTPALSKDVAARRNQKGGKTFLLLLLFTLKPETGVSRTSLFAVLPLAPKRLLTLCLRLVSWSERGEKTANCF